MNPSDQAVADPKPADTDVPPRAASSAKSPLSKAMAAFSLVTLIGVTGALYYAWQHWQGAREELASLKQRAEDTRLAQQALLETINSTRQALTTQQKSLAQQQNVLDRHDEKQPNPQPSATAHQREFHEKGRDPAANRLAPDRRLSRAVGPTEGTSPRWLDSETTSLLRTAANNLELGHDRDGALKALQRAETLLRQAGDSHDTVRALLAEEIKAVEAYQPTDVQQLATAIRKIQNETRKLPLKSDAPPQPIALQRVTSPPPRMRHRSHKPRRPTISNHPRAMSGRLVPNRSTSRQPSSGTTIAYENWLRQTLRMRLDNARIGALSRNGPLYLTSLDTSVVLVRDVYAEGAARTLLLAELAALATVPINPEPPEIGASLDALMSLKRDQATP